MDNVVVTGASKGLGLAVCSYLLKEGYRVIGIARTESDELKTLSEGNPDSMFYVQYDFKDTANIHEMVKSITGTHGHIYGLVNNAAVGHDGVLGTMHEKQICELIQVNVEAPILLTKYISRSMLMNRRGRIVNISSIIASTGFSGLSVYGAAKAALNGFTKSLSRELGKAGITVNSVAPGYMETAMTSGLKGDKLESIKRRSPLGHLATVEDVANTVVFLMSEKAKNMTGTIVTVDAGSTA
ncbi:SDR family NAD(P)-dependent oxidoreductase [Sphaerochaeta sp.]|uniref:SDR family NAD(P)-dependent oxidoreductase n=1 Tax=Sphaerochaeta sp. TaxID=1972642 RepID=UPI003D136E16